MYVDKIAIGFMADILYIKGIIFWEEYEAIMDAKSPSDLETIVDKLLRGDFNVLKRGESYLNYKQG
jgi:hypothetical protein